MEKNNDRTEPMNDASEKIAVGAAQYELQDIPLEKLIPNPANAKIYETGKIDELSQSILLTGKVLQNIVVTKADAKGNHTIIAGHRRLLACQKLVEQGHKEFAEMPCVVITESDKLMQELFLILSNSTSRALSGAEKMRQVERATAILTKLKNKKKTSGRVRDIVAEMLNTTTGQIARYNVIFKGLKNETLRAAFEQGKIGISAAYVAARLDEKGQAVLAEKMVADGENTLRIRDVEEQRKKEEFAQAVDGGVKQSGKNMEEVPESEVKAAECVPTTESEKKKYEPTKEHSIRLSAIREVIEDLKDRKVKKEEEADKCKEDGEERNEQIALAAADFYEELIAYAEQEKTTMTMACNEK